MFSAARWRLTAVFTAVLIVILVVSGVVVYFTTRSLLYDRVDAELREKAERDVQMVTHERPGDPLTADGDKESGGDKEDDTSFAFDPGGYFFAIVDPEGGIYESSSEVKAAALVSASTLAEALAEGSAIEDVESAAGQTQRIYVLPAEAPDGTQVFLEIGRSIEGEQDTLSELRTILAAVVGISVVPALAGGYLLSGRALRPIKRSIEAQRAFVADASHELRTPVAVVRTNAELLELHARSGTLGQAGNDLLAVEDILSETERMGRLVGQMLTLAQADAGQPILSRSPLALNEVAEEVARSMRALAEARGVQLEAAIEPGVWVNGDRERLREVMVTVLDNALKYSGQGGRVNLGVSHHGRRAVVRVADNGAGIPAEALGRIFERFYRADKARSRDEGGTGLGLAIAQEIVHAHGGTIRIDSEAGMGTTVTIELRTLAHETEPGATRVSQDPGAPA